MVTIRDPPPPPTSLYLLLFRICCHSLLCLTLVLETPLRGGGNEGEVLQWPHGFLGARFLIPSGLVGRDQQNLSH